MCLCRAVVSGVLCRAVLCRVDPTKQVPQALCMCTTRELVAQNLAVLQRMAKYTNITSTSTADDGDAAARNRSLNQQVGSCGCVLWLI
jgi:ATP-dependent RNA helicase DDX19/DBP5